MGGYSTGGLNLQSPENLYHTICVVQRLSLLKGFYRTKYMKPDGTESWLAITQFESTGARKSFPCEDEPGKKAIFKVKLGRTVDMTSTSNMPLIGTKESVFIGDRG